MAEMVSMRTTKQNVGLIICLPILVATVSVCSHLSIALADNSAYKEAYGLASPDKIARYIEQPPVTTAPLSEKGPDLVKYKTEVFACEDDNRVQIIYDISTKVIASSGS